MERFECLAKQVYEILKKSELDLEIPHAKNTLKWIFKMKPNPSEALMIAAIGHDIERGYPPRVKQKEGEAFDELKARHSKRSAEKMTILMKKLGYDLSTIDAVVDLVLKHEVGGTEDSDILMDADSISYFDPENLEYYAQRKTPEEVKYQIEYKFNRCSKRAQKYIKKLLN